MISSSLKDKKQEEDANLEKSSAKGEPDKDTDPSEQRAKALEKLEENESKAKKLQQEAKSLKPEVVKAES